MATKTKKKVVSGFCANKQCEGTKPKSRSGTPLKTCEFWESCACSCHQQITQMYELTGVVREPPEQSHEYLEWVREQRAQFDMPSPFELPPVEPLSSFGGTDTPSGDEGPVTTPPSAPATPLSTGPHGVVEPSFKPTPTGRRARGQLEYDVLQICDEYSRDVYEWEYCTPKLVAERVGKMNETEPPSTGAINAVWDRWEKLGFAKQGKKPSRFICFEIEGSVRTLEMLKLRAKRDKKRIKAEVRRGSLRPRAR